MPAQKVYRKWETHPASRALIRSLTRLVQKRVQEWALTLGLICPCKEEAVPAKPNEASLGNTENHLPTFQLLLLVWYRRGLRRHIRTSLYGAYLEYGTGTTFRRATFDAPARRSPAWRNVPARFLAEALRSRERQLYRPDIPRSHLSSMRPLLPRETVPARSSEDPSRFSLGLPYLWKMYRHGLSSFHHPPHLLSLEEVENPYFVLRYLLMCEYLGFFFLIKTDEPITFTCIIKALGSKWITAK